jgi:hypothetical protein
VNVKEVSMSMRVMMALVLVAIGSLAGPAAADSPSTRLRQLERKVQVIKEKSHMLRRDVELLKGKLLGATGVTTIVHRNQMGSSFRLLELDYLLDGKKILSRRDRDGSLSGLETIDVLATSLAPGGHTLVVRMYYRGHGYGVFEYFNRYRFTVEEKYTFTVRDAGPTKVIVDGYEQGDATVPMRDRPAGRMNVE